ELATLLYASAARVYETDVGSPERAIDLYGKVLKIDPRNINATECLQMLYQASGQYAEMSRVLQHKAEILDDIDGKKDALFRAAMLEEEVLARQEEAIAVYLKVLDVDGEDLRSVDALIRLYLGLSRWADLLTVYSRKADLVLDPEEKKLILYQVGAVYEQIGRAHV